MEGEGLEDKSWGIDCRGELRGDGVRTRLWAARVEKMRPLVGVHTSAVAIGCEWVSFCELDPIFTVICVFGFVNIQSEN